MNQRVSDAVGVRVTPGAVMNEEWTRAVVPVPVETISLHADHNMAHMELTQLMIHTTTVALRQVAMKLHVAGVVDQMGTVGAVTERGVRDVFVINQSAVTVVEQLTAHLQCPVDITKS